MGEIPRDTPHPPTVERGHEQSDVQIRPLAIFLAGLAVSLVVTGALMAWLFSALETQAKRSEPEAPPLAADDRPTPGPLLQVSPRQDLEVLRTREERLLNSTGWVVREAGVARIPLERAIELTAQRGFPNWPAAEVGAPPQADGSEKAPLAPAARSPEGTGQTTPVEGDPQR